MKLDDIKEWGDIREFLSEHFSGDKNCICHPKNPKCEDCKEYFKIVNYQQNIARTKYKQDTPTDKWNKSFEDTLNYIKENYTN